MWELICRPVALVTHWTIQARKFFPHHDLSVKVWSSEAWRAEEGNEGTVWIVKGSWLSHISSRSTMGNKRKAPF